jgi:hypothetical protein
MHAYHPDDPEQHGIAIGVGGAGETLELVQLAPYALQSLGIEQTPLRIAS